MRSAPNRRVLLLCLPLLAAGWLLSVFPAQARVGEARAQVEARYGGPGKEVGDQVLYSKDQVNISVFYSPGNVVTMEIYTHQIDAAGARADFTPAEIEALLHDEAAGQSWGKAEVNGLTTWRRTDGQVFGRYRPSDQLIVFVSPDHQAVAGKSSVILKDGKSVKP